MELSIGIVILIITLSVGGIFLKHTSQSPKKEKAIYAFEVKQAIMTAAEGRFFGRLTHIVGDRFFVMPQAHLSSFLEHKIKGQNWHAAFSTINGKSVDFLLVEKTTLRPAIAIELDDWTHDREGRVQRDEKVATILKSAGILLARFDNPDTSEREIIDTIYNLASEKNTQNDSGHQTK